VRSFDRPPLRSFFNGSFDTDGSADGKSTASRWCVYELLVVSTVENVRDSCVHVEDVSLVAEVITAVDIVGDEPGFRPAVAALVHG
jgi:hypothetical protein